MSKALIGAAAGLFAATAALAQTTPPPGVSQGTTPPVLTQPAPRIQRMHMHMLSNKVMTRDEVTAHIRRMFDRLDANRDGLVTRDEAASMHGRMMRAHQAGEAKMPGRDLKRHDRGAAFDRLDVNHDGTISRQEFVSAKPRVEERRIVVMDGHSPDGRGMGRMGLHAAGFGRHLFDMADANRDGRVSMQEATNAALQHFDRADLNHDGKLTPEERRQAHELMRRQGRPA